MPSPSVALSLSYLNNYRRDYLNRRHSLQALEKGKLHGMSDDFPTHANVYSDRKENHCEAKRKMSHSTCRISRLRLICDAQALRGTAAFCSFSRLKWIAMGWGTAKTRREPQSESAVLRGILGSVQNPKTRHEYNESNFFNFQNLGDSMTRHWSSDEEECHSR